MGRAKKIIIGTIGTAAVAVGLVGVLHLPFARAFLMRIGGCPLGQVSPQQVETARRDAIRDARGDTMAPARPALGFALDRSTHDEVVAWAEHAGIDCDESREGTLLLCKDVPASALDEAAKGAPLSEVAFAFSIQNKQVIAITTLRRSLDIDSATQAMKSVKEQLHATLGAPSSQAGDSLSASYATATFSYAYRDYLAHVTATTIPGRGIMMREEYLSARD